MRIDNVQQTVHVQRMMYQMDERMGDFADLSLCIQQQISKD